MGPHLMQTYYENRCSATGGGPASLLCSPVMSQIDDQEDITNVNARPILSDRDPDDLELKLVLNDQKMIGWESIGIN